jgi:hypothetical protein
MFALNSTTREAKALLADLAELTAAYDALRTGEPYLCRRCRRRRLVAWAVRGLAVAAVAAEYAWISHQFGMWR